MNKPYSASCDNNREPIFSVLETLLNHCRSVLEIGSGTGQHAVYFAAKLPQLVWQCSDLEENHAGIRQWLDEAALPNQLQKKKFWEACQPLLKTDASGVATFNGDRSMMTSAGVVKAFKLVNATIS